MTAHPTRRATGVALDGTAWDWLSTAVEGACAPEGLLYPNRRRDGSAVRGGKIAACRLQPEPTSARTAREFARTTLHDWALDDLGDDVAVVASELVGNAVRHGVRSSARLVGRPIRLGLVDLDDHVLCAVTDPGIGVPVVREPDYLAESGRGLHVIASLCGEWGWTPPDEAGKVVWATFAARTAAG